MHTIQKSVAKTKQDRDSFLFLSRIAQKLACTTNEALTIVQRDDFPKPLKIANRWTCWSCRQVENWMLTQAQQNVENH